MITRIKEIITFVRVEALSGFILFLAAAIAIYLQNSPFSKLYEGFTHAHVLFDLGSISLDLSTHEIVNDVLMAIFFLLVGLEIKREILTGELKNFSTALLPIIGAAGGMIFPALFYVVFNYSDPLALSGWAIPTATDIAFSLGVISLFGRSLPFSLKVFLTALAIIDDLLAILVIAFFYTASLSATNLLFALSILLGLIILNRIGKTKLKYYFIPGIFLFYFIHNSGVHATIAGVLLAMTIPLKGKTPKSASPLKKLEHVLHPWVGYGILPLFAFVNAGVHLEHISFEMLSHPITLGCLLGLFVGKQVGVFLTSFIAAKLGIVRLPDGATWWQFYGVSILTGIGFTMSLFIGGLAFSDPSAIETVKLGVLLGSLLSALVGAGILIVCRNRDSGERA